MQKSTPKVKTRDTLFFQFRQPFLNDLVVGPARTEPVKDCGPVSLQFCRKICQLRKQIFALASCRCAHLLSNCGQTLLHVTMRGMSARDAGSPKRARTR